METERTVTIPVEEYVSLIIEKEHLKTIKRLAFSEADLDWSGEGLNLDTGAVERYIKTVFDADVKLKLRELKNAKKETTVD
jgi:hypothetical protein